MSGGFTEMEKRVFYGCGDQVGFDLLWQVLKDPWRSCSVATVSMVEGGCVRG